MLCTNLLGFVSEIYPGEVFENEFEMHLLNPLKIPNENLEKFPKVTILQGTYDALWDANYYFYHWLLQNNVEANLIEYEYFPHGFLGLLIQPKYKIKELLDDYVKTILDQISEMINEFDPPKRVKVY